MRRGVSPMVLAARRLPWRVTHLTGTANNGAALDELVRWCIRELPREAWYYPLGGGRTARTETDFSRWGFLRREDAEAFAALARKLLGDDGGIKVYEEAGGRA